jgi:hypothetical protein
VIQKDQAIHDEQDLCFQYAYNTADKAAEAVEDHTPLDQSDWEAFRNAMQERSQRHINLVDARYAEVAVKCEKHIEQKWHKCSPIG